MPHTSADKDLKSTDWEDVYSRGMLSERDSSTSSSSSSAGSTAPEVTVPDVVRYIGDNLPNTPTKFLLELRKSLEIVSSNGLVNCRQFKEASRFWIARLKKLRYQDSNRNMYKGNCADFLIDDLAREADGSDCADYARNNDEIKNLPALQEFKDTDALTDFASDSSPGICEKISSSSMTDMTSGSTTKKDVLSDEVTEVELRLKVRRTYEENALLEEELIDAKESIVALHQHRDCLQRELERTKKKCLQLQQENDEQKAVLDEITEKERACNRALQRIEKQRHSLQEKLEAAELELQSVPALNGKLQKIEKELQQHARLVAKTQLALEERQNECEDLRAMIVQLQEKNACLQETSEKMIQSLREQNQQLAMENVEFLTERSIVNEFGYEDKFSTSSVSSIGYCLAQSTPYQPVKLERQESLFDELKASGFGTERGGTSSRSQQLEDELNMYDEELCGIFRLLESVVEILTTSTDAVDVPTLRLKDDEDSKPQITKAIKQKIFILQETILETAKKKPVSDSSVQVQAEAIASYLQRQLGIPSFQDHLKTIAKNSRKSKETCRATLRRTDEAQQEDPFLKIARTSATTVEEYAVIGPIVAALDKIVEDTSSRRNSSPERTPDGNLRSRSIYTYTTCRASEDTSRSDNPPDLHQGRPASFGKGDCIRKEVDPRECSTTKSASPADTGKSKDGESLDRPMAEDTKVTENKAPVWRSEVVVEANLVDDGNVDVSGRVDESVEKDIAKREGELLGNSRTIQVPVLSFSSSQDQSPRIEKAEDLETTRNSLAKTKFSAYREALDPALKKVPRRKASVFHRSFDVSALENQVVEERLAEMEVKRSASSPSMQEESKNEEDKSERSSDRSDLFKYTFSNTYRSQMDFSDSSNSTSPRKSDTSTNNDVSFEESLRTPATLVTLKPPKFTLPKLNERFSSNESSVARSLDETSSMLFDESTNQRQTRNFFSETRTIDHESPRDHRATSPGDVNFRRDYSTADSNSLTSTPRNNFDSEISPRDELSQKFSSETYLLSTGPSLPCNKARVATRGKVKDPGDSPSEEKENSGARRRAARPVALAMSSREESSESECDQAETNLPQQSQLSVQAADQGEPLISSTPFVPAIVQDQRVAIADSPINGERFPRSKINARNPGIGKNCRVARQRILAIRRTLSDGENSDCSPRECRCCRNNANFPGETLGGSTETQQRVFPSLTDTYLQESGIANLTDTQLEFNENMSEEELERKYSAFSLGLCTDRVTLNRRVALSIRQRDQAERNLSCEVQKMHHDIQELAPLCTDRESLERVERVRQQLDMIARCANRVSCAAESLGAVHQENRVSRAILLADKYLQTLRAKCDKLAGEIAETKRILMENNIVIEEHPTELADDLPRILRYRSGLLPANNRTMITKRRASIATISRPLGNLQDTTKEGIRQRNSVSGRVTLRRPSFSYETQKWESEKLDKMESSSSVGELRGIYEQVESRRNSREENNNILRVNQTVNSTTSTNSRTVDGQVWSSCKEEPSLEESTLENNFHDSRLCSRTQDSFRITNKLPWRSMVWFVLMFFLGFYVNHAISSTSVCNSAIHKWWSIQEILSQYLQVKNEAPRPI